MGQGRSPHSCVRCFCAAASRRSACLCRRDSESPGVDRFVAVVAVDLFNPIVSAWLAREHDSRLRSLPDSPPENRRQCARGIWIWQRRPQEAPGRSRNRAQTRIPRRKSQRKRHDAGIDPCVRRAQRMGARARSRPRRHRMTVPAARRHHASTCTNDARHDPLERSTKLYTNGHRFSSLPIRLVSACCVLVERSARCRRAVQRRNSNSLFNSERRHSAAVVATTVSPSKR